MDAFLAKERPALGIFASVPVIRIVVASEHQHRVVDIATAATHNDVDEAGHDGEGECARPKWVSECKRRGDKKENTDNGIIGKRRGRSIDLLLTGLGAGQTVAMALVLTRPLNAGIERV